MRRPSFDGTTPADDLKPLPETPGTYFFLGSEGEILYIGKATSLRDRVRSYFSRDIAVTRGPKIVRMLSLARSVAWKGTDSVLEALLSESRLIREHQPPYNTDAKDDKSYNHVVITDGEFPRVLLVRGRDLSEGKFTAPIRSLFGPFPNGGQLREALRIVRKIFPFRDRCEPAREGEAAKPCFNRQIGLCPGVCTGEVSPREYGRTIRNIERFFRGEKEGIVRSLEREMRTAAGKLEFERADEIKRTIFALGHIRDVSLLAGEKGLDRGVSSGSVRIEAYDVAHLGGSSAVGVMTVVSGGQADLGSYRKFLLRGKHAGNDLSALEEILRRRMRHTEWPVPDVVVTDGNVLQKGIAEYVFGEDGGTFSGVRFVGVVKNAKHQPERLIGDRATISEYRRDILLGNAEAHRFALSYHRRRRSVDFLGKGTRRIPG